ncbi:hypothetical protein BC829DRAFT_409415 [Chytridium lagenaria]|nr:hypothetical protein BC829DRAFT_409415 [Chytridium lagenaria]
MLASTQEPPIVINPGPQAPPILTTSNDDSSRILIVGLHMASNGRSCIVHDDPKKPCGTFLSIGDLVRFKQGLIQNEKGEFEPAMKVLLFDAGHETCTVGFLPRAFLYQAEALHNKFGQVVELKAESENSNMRRFSFRNGGAGLVLMLDNVPEFE